MTVGFEAITSGMAGVGMKILFWSGYALFGLLVFGVVGFYMYYKNFIYKMTYWETIGSGSKGESLTIDKPKTMRMKWNKTKTAWQLFKPLFKGKTIEPFDAKYIYPGKNVYAFKFNETFIPAKITFDNENRAGIEPIPHHIRSWQMLELKQNEIEFSKKDFWTQNKALVFMIVCVIACCGVCAITVYYSLKTASGAAADISSATSAAKALKASMGGVVPR